MNTQEIYAKRIEEASIDYTMSTKPMCIAGDAFADMARELNKNPAFIAGAKYILQNQWIPVDKALPERSKYDDGEESQHSIRVIVRFENGAVTSAYYSYPTKIWYYAIGRKGDNSIEARITHWMPVPSLKGGEE